MHGELRLEPTFLASGHKLPGTCGPGHGLTCELHAEAAWESTKKTFTQQKTVPSSNQLPPLTPDLPLQETGVIHNKDLSKFCPSQAHGCLRLLPPLKFIYLQSTMEQLVNLII